MKQLVETMHKQVLAFGANAVDLNNCALKAPRGISFSRVSKRVGAVVDAWLALEKAMHDLQAICRGDLDK